MGDIEQLIALLIDIEGGCARAVARVDGLEVRIRRTSGLIERLGGEVNRAALERGVTDSLRKARQAKEEIRIAGATARDARRRLEGHAREGPAPPPGDGGGAGDRPAPPAPAARPPTSRAGASLSWWGAVKRELKPPRSVPELIDGRGKRFWTSWALGTLTAGGGTLVGAALEQILGIGELGSLAGETAAGATGGWAVESALDARRPRGRRPALDSDNPPQAILGLRRIFYNRSRDKNRGKLQRRGWKLGDDVVTDWTDPRLVPIKLTAVATGALFGFLTIADAPALTVFFANRVMSGGIWLWTQDIKERG